MKSNRRITTPRVVVAPILAHPSHADIAAAAERLWIERGRPAGQDEVIWLEAERRLRPEVPARPGSGDPLAQKSVGNTDQAMDELDELYPGSDGSASTSL
jgi:hypothetical protein